MTTLVEQLVPDEPWRLVETLLPPPPRPWWGGRIRVGLSDSALSKQLTTLEQAGYVQIRKGFVDRHRDQVDRELPDELEEALRDPLAAGCAAGSAEIG
jgi:hypothetical protein